MKKHFKVALALVLVLSCFVSFAVSSFAAIPSELQAKTRYEWLAGSGDLNTATRNNYYRDNVYRDSLTPLPVLEIPGSFFGNTDSTGEGAIGYGDVGLISLDSVNSPLASIYSDYNLYYGYNKSAPFSDDVGGVQRLRITTPNISAIPSAYRQNLLLYMYSNVDGFSNGDYGRNWVWPTQPTVGYNFRFVFYSHSNLSSYLDWMHLAFIDSDGNLVKTFKFSPSSVPAGYVYISFLTTKRIRGVIQGWHLTSYTGAPVTLTFPSAASESYEPTESAIVDAQTNKITGSIDSLKTAVGTGISSIITNTNTQVNGIKTSISDAKTAIVSSVSSVGTKVDTMSTDIQNKLTQVTGDLIDTINPPNKVVDPLDTSGVDGANSQHDAVQSQIDNLLGDSASNFGLIGALVNPEMMIEWFPSMSFLSSLWNRIIATDGGLAVSWIFPMFTAFVAWLLGRRFI
ncbi:MAG: hypothetical protein LBN05_02880 [Oscillospiraceae bacterium]|jgi:hypothetical protein|nr:hypothetical protein [Oscillospiraceae bacterium]